MILVNFPRKMKVFAIFGTKVIKWGGHYKVILGLKKSKKSGFRQTLENLENLENVSFLKNFRENQGNSGNSF